MLLVRHRVHFHGVEKCALISMVEPLCIEGGAVRSFDRAKKWLYLYPEAGLRILRFVMVRECP